MRLIQARALKQMVFVLVLTLELTLNILASTRTAYAAAPICIYESDLMGTFVIECSLFLQVQREITDLRDDTCYEYSSVYANTAVHDYDYCLQFSPPTDPSFLPNPQAWPAGCIVDYSQRIHRVSIDWSTCVNYERFPQGVDPGSLRGCNGQEIVITAGKYYRFLGQGPGESESCAEEVSESEFNTIYDAFQAGNADQYAKSTPVTPVQQTPNNDETCSRNVDVLSWVICPIIGLITMATDTFYNLADDALNFKVDETKAPEFKDAWGKIRDIANALFVIALLIAIITQAITGKM